jgi:hypothetical protein
LRIQVLKQIISGGQYGADQGGSEAAITLGLEPGGFIPKNYLTERGALSLDFVRRWKLTEHNATGYPPRTAANVRWGHGTVIFGDVTSAGSKLTLRLCKEEGKPCLTNPTSDQLKRWVEENKIEILNVAGNRESKAPGIYQQVHDTIVAAFGGK